VAATPTTTVPPTVTPLTVVHSGAAQSMFEYVHVLPYMPSDNLSSSPCIGQLLAGHLVSIAMIFTTLTKLMVLVELQSW